MSALARVLAASPLGADAETVVDLLAALAAPQGLPVRLAVNAADGRVFIRLSVAAVDAAPAAEDFGEACAGLDALAVRWGSDHYPTRRVWWAELTADASATNTKD